MISSLKIGDEDIVFSDKAKSLGAYLDKDLTMNIQITNVSKAIYLEIRSFRVFIILCNTRETIKRS